MKNENTKNSETTETTITVEAPASAEVTVETKPAPKSKEKGGAKAKAGKTTTTKADSKKDAGKAKDAKAEPKAETKKEMPPSLKVDRKLFDEKLEKLNKKLEKEKRQTTAAGYHVAFGYFLARTKKGQTLILEYHQKLKPNQWIIRDDKGKVLGEPKKTLWQAHDAAVNQF